MLSCDTVCGFLGGISGDSVLYKLRDNLQQADVNNIGHAFCAWFTQRPVSPEKLTPRNITPLVLPKYEKG